MKIIKEYNNCEFVFDNTKSKLTKIDIDINEDILLVDYNEIIDTQFSGGNVSKEFENLKKLLNLGAYSKSPCGGFINFHRIRGSKGNYYILFSGVNEVSNSHYIVTIHKIIEDKKVVS